MRLSIAFTVLLIFIAGCSQGQETHPMIYAPPQQAAQTDTQEQISQNNDLSKEEIDLKITSPAYKDGEAIPAEYTCKGANVNPEIIISGVPSDAKSLALTFDDPDAPMGVWDHWVMWNIPVSAKVAKDSVPSGAVEGKNSWGKNAYGGPCPPSGTHRYYFRLYALDTTMTISGNAGKKELENAIKGHILAKAELMGKVTK